MRQEILSVLLLAMVLQGCASTASPSFEGEARKLSDREKAVLYIQAANAALREGDTITAFQDLVSAEALDPKNGDVPHTRALAYFRRKELVTAEKEARKAYETDRSSPSYQLTLGRILSDLGRDAEAKKLLEAAGAVPTFTEGYKAETMLGVMAYRKNQFSEARKHFDRAIVLQRAGACVAFYYRGHLAMKDNRYVDAIADYSEASKAYCGSFQDAHLAVGIAYMRSGQYALARKKFLDIKQMFPNTAVASQAMDRLRFIP